MTKILKGNKEMSVNDNLVAEYIENGWTVIGKDGKPAEFFRPMSYDELMSEYMRVSEHDRAISKTLEETEQRLMQTEAELRKIRKKKEE